MPNRRRSIYFRRIITISSQLDLHKLAKERSPITAFQRVCIGRYGQICIPLLLNARLPLPAKLFFTGKQVEQVVAASICQGLGAACQWSAEFECTPIGLMCNRNLNGPGLGGINLKA